MTIQMLIDMAINNASFAKNGYGEARYADIVCVRSMTSRGQRLNFYYGSRRCTRDKAETYFQK